MRTALSSTAALLPPAAAAASAVVCAAATLAASSLANAAEGVSASLASSPGASTHDFDMKARRRGDTMGSGASPRESPCDLEELLVAPVGPLLIASSLADSRSGESGG